MQWPLKNHNDDHKNIQKNDTIIKISFGYNKILIIIEVYKQRRSLWMPNLRIYARANPKFREKFIDSNNNDYNNDKRKRKHNFH